MRVNVGVIFGGKSVEHEISIISAVEAMGYMDENKYNIIPIYIDKNNVWYTGYHFRDIINYRDMSLVKRYATRVSLVKTNHCFALQTMGIIKRNIKQIDVVLPICHGSYVEDGCLQGYLDMLGIPYAGSSVLASAIGQDKVIMKQILEQNNIPVPKYIWFYGYEYIKNKKAVIAKIADLKYPLYVKPASLGSSIGITKVLNEDGLNTAIKEAMKFDKKIIVEECIKNTKEVNVSVLGNYEDCEASDIEELNISDEFFSFKEKYIENYSKILKKNKKAKPLLSKEMMEDIKKYAIATFKALTASGVARVDFLIDEKSQKIYVSEINTIPGSLSAYLWLAKKKNQEELILDLLNLAFKEKKDEKELTYAFEGNLLEKFDSLKGKKINNKK